MRKLGIATNALIIALVVFSTLSLFAQQGASSPAAPGSEKPGKANGHSAGPPAADTCPTRMPKEDFAVDFSGSVSNTGRTYEGPVCIEVFYNPIEQFVGLQSTTTTATGPDLSKVVLGGPTAQGPAKVSKVPPITLTNLPDVVDQLQKSADALTGALDQMKANYVGVVQKEDTAIYNISTLRQTTQLLSRPDTISKVKNGYAALQDSLGDAKSSVANFTPSDQPNNSGDVLLRSAQDQENKLNALPLDFASGTQKTFECKTSKDAVGWSDWIAQCKDQYTALKSLLDANLQTAKDYASDGDNVKALKKKVAIFQYWDALFSTLGLTTDLDDVSKADISPYFYTRTAVRCGILFNQTSNTAINIVTADLTPTLQGDPPTIKAQNAFVTVSCATPFSVSAGIGFHTIEQKQFAIVQSPDWKGGTVNTFGVTSDSNITPVALALVHVRLAEWDRHKYAFYGTLGVGGSVQNQSNSSPVQFLPGVSTSFWRTMYITVGPDIGNKTSLAGGFKVGDVVPSGVTSVPTSTSHAVGFGFAISFTKP